MICNIIDKRSRPFRWKHISAIIEPVFLDNTAADADEAREPRGEYSKYGQKEDTSLEVAVSWAHPIPYQAALYLYGLGQGISASAGVVYKP